MVDGCFRVVLHYRTGSDVDKVTIRSRIDLYLHLRTMVPRKVREELDPCGSVDAAGASSEYAEKFTCSNLQRSRMWLYIDISMTPFQQFINHSFYHEQLTTPVRVCVYVLEKIITGGRRLKWVVCALRQPVAFQG